MRPRSIAVVGATPRDGAVGNQTLRNLIQGGYAGALYAINPRHREIHGIPCFAGFADLPGRVEHAIFALGDPRMEAALDDALDHGVRAVTLLSALVLDSDRDPPLRERVRARLLRAGVVACGGNGMGFCNFTDRVWAYGFETRRHGDRGNVTLISHSGAGLCGILDTDERLQFNLAISPGQELSVTMADYLDFALEQPETRVVGLFMETVRDPDAMIRAFGKARRRSIPIVAIKVGRTDMSARLAVSHSGALAGCDTSYDALFDRYGIQRVRDMDELAAALVMFAQPHPVAAGGLVSIHDSGGERQLLIDVAAELEVPLAELSAGTSGKLAAMLDPGLPAVNPLDAWSAGGPDAHETIADCFAIMLKDPAAAFGAVVHDRVADGRIYPGYAGYLQHAHAATGKPVFLVSNHQGTGADPLVTRLTRQGFPVLDGLAPFLIGARCLLAYRDFTHRVESPPPDVDPAILERWRWRLADEGTPDEATSMELLAEAGLPMNRGRLAEDEAAAVAAATALGFPVVMKTARAGIAHKTDVRGVILDVADEEGCRVAYRSLARRLGGRVLVAPMIRDPGVEMILGMVNDAQFGPLVMLGFGGVHAETLRDVRFALPPFGTGTARRLLDTLRMRPLLDGARGAPAPAVDAYCQAAARLSVVAHHLREMIAEIDLNPVILSARGCLAVDALIVTRALQHRGGDRA
ncbi:MAG: Protein lysine acetyltransferase Pka [Gammaproteobacteria bacterium]|nr:Protein lysine acetyltransferase Pka [Gammaproteobacteria bacterium]